jgi:large subunit ribosomal protein L28
LLNNPIPDSIALLKSLDWSRVMSKICQVTGKKTSRGFKYAIRGIAKKKKGIGLKTTGKTKRRFQPNLFTKRFWFGEENRFVTIRLSTAAIRTIDKRGIAAVVREMRAGGQHI